MNPIPQPNRFELSDADDAALEAMKKTLRKHFEQSSPGYDAEQRQAAAASALAFAAVCAEQRERARIGGPGAKRAAKV